MQRLLIIASCVMVFATSTVSAQWQVQQASQMALWKSVYFLSSDTGFVVTNSARGIRTTNGGREWITSGSPPVAWVPAGYGIDFPSPTVGYVADNAIMKTTDAGRSWNQVHRHPKRERVYASIAFVDESTGVAVGNCLNDYYGRPPDNSIVQTNDGGQSWKAVKFLPEGNALYGCPGPVIFRSANRGYLVSYVVDIVTTSSDIWFSQDGGFSWGAMRTWILFPGSAYFRINSMCFSDSNTLWVGGARYLERPRSLKDIRVLRTQNANDPGNEIWDTVSYVFPNTVSVITFADSLRGFIGDEKGNIYSTTDGGTTWKNDNVPSDGRSINSISIAGGSRVFAVGDGGLILRYDMSVSVQEPNTSPPLLLFPNPTTGRVRVDIGDAEPAVITVIDMMGRIQDVAMVSPNELDVSMLPTGTYVVMVRRGTRMSTELLVKRNE